MIRRTALEKVTLLVLVFCLYTTGLFLHASTTENQEGGETSRQISASKFVLLDDDPEWETGLRIETQPSEAQIYLNNTHIGKTPLIVIPEPGWHQIVIQKKGYYSYSKWVLYREEDKKNLVVTLEQIIGYLNLSVLLTVPPQKIGAPENPSQMQTYLPDIHPKPDIQIQPSELPSTTVLLTAPIPNLEIKAADHQITPGVTALPVGKYTLVVRLFGYQRQEITIHIKEKETVNLTIPLKPASFDITNLRVSRPRFNPLNPGTLGRSNIRFTVSSYGSGNLIIISPAGDTVREKTFSDFNSWEQEFLWNGRDKKGGLLKEGLYTISVQGTSTVNGHKTTKTTEITIDKSLFIRPGTSLLGPGRTIYSTTPDIMGQGSFQMGFFSQLYLRKNYNEKDPAQNKLQASSIPVVNYIRGTIFDGWEMGLSMGVVPWKTDTFFLSFFTKTQLFQSDLFTFGTAGSFRYHFYPDSEFIYGSSSEGALELPSALRLGKIMLSISPEMGYAYAPYNSSTNNNDNNDSPPEAASDPARPPAKPGFYSALNTALILDQGNITMALSGKIRSAVFYPSYPHNGMISFIGIGSEAHWLIPNTNFVITLAASGEYTFPAAYNSEKREEHMQIGLGGGISIIY